MAVGTATAIIGGAGALMSGYQAIKGASDKKKAQRELKDYEREELNNAFVDMPISREGIDYMQEENARTSAALVDAARNSGSRSIIGAAPKIAAQQTALDANIAKYLDEQYNRRNQLIAGDNIRIEGVRENRDYQNINALSSQVQAGNQNMWDGMMGLGSSLAYMGRSMTPGERPEVTAVDTTGAPGVNLPQTGMPTNPAPLNQYPKASYFPFNIGF